MAGISEEEFAPLEEKHRMELDRLIEYDQGTQKISAKQREWNADRMEAELPPHSFDGSINPVDVAAAIRRKIQAAKESTNGDR